MLRQGWNAALVGPSCIAVRKATALDVLQRYNEAIEAWRAAVDAEDQTGTPEGGWVEPLKLAEQALANKVDQLKKQAAEALSKGRVDQAV